MADNSKIAGQRHPTKGQRWYGPVERPERYPLELTEDAEICLWASEGKCKWTIAYWHTGLDGPDLMFVGDRPLDRRVNWRHFRELIEQGHGIQCRRFQESQH